MQHEANERVSRKVWQAFNRSTPELGVDVPDVEEHIDSAHAERCGQRKSNKGCQRQNGLGSWT